jgi:hypothetical protein
MPRRAFEELASWEQGCITAISDDLLPKGAFPRGRNTALYQNGLLGSRKGATVFTPDTLGEAINGLFQLTQSDGTRTLLRFGDDGSLSSVNDDGEFTEIEATGFTAETVPELRVAKDYLFITNGEDLKKFDGTTLSNFGIERPVAPTVAAGTAGTTNGVYDVALTYYNEDSGEESSRSDFTEVTVTNQKIDISWAAPTDTQVTHVRIYVRKQSLGSIAFRMITDLDPAPAADGFEVDTLAATLNIRDGTFSALTIIAPSPSDAVPPPDGARFVTWHKSRIFVAEGDSVYYSELDRPERFDLYNRVEPITPQEGESITGLHSAHDKLLIFKQTKVYAISGDDPSNWSIDLISVDSGTDSFRSIVTVEGVTYYWSSVHQLMGWPGTGAPLPISKPLLDPTLRADVINVAGLSHCAAIVDSEHQVILWSLPEYGKSTNTIIVPFNYRLRKFEAEYWNPFNVSSFCVWRDSTDTPWVLMGNYHGQIFKNWTGNNDGIPEDSTHSGTITSASSSKITDSRAEFRTTGGGLVGRMVYVISADQSIVQRREITANTATELTVAPNWEITPNPTYTYVVGGIYFEMDTPWMHGGVPFEKKRYEHLFSMAVTASSRVQCVFDFFTDYSLAEPKRSFPTTLAAQAEYDVAIYDTDRYASSAFDYAKKRLAKNGKAWRIRIRKLQNNTDLMILKLGVSSVFLSTKH